MSRISSGDLKLKLTQSNPKPEKPSAPTSVGAEMMSRWFSLGKPSLKQSRTYEKRSIYHFTRVHSDTWEGVSLIRAATHTHSLTLVQGINEPKGKCYMTLKFIRCRSMFSHETKANKSIIQGSRSLYMPASPEEVLYATYPVTKSHEESGSILILSRVRFARILISMRF